MGRGFSLIKRTCLLQAGVRNGVVYRFQRYDFQTLES